MVRAEGAPGDGAAHPRWNLVARREGPRAGETVHFNSHIDVVEAGRGWSEDPWGGAVRDGWVWGRGACDMKGGLAASVIAAEAFLEARPDFAGAVEISCTADEESGGWGGVAHLARQGRFAHVGHVVIPEPLDPDRVCLGHRGVWWAEIETRGVIAHGSMPFLGDCAVRHMAAVVAEMERTLWPRLAQRTTEMPVVPEGARASTLNVNSLHGGQAEPAPGDTGLPSPCVPDSARMVIDRRFLIEERVEDVEAEMRALLERVALMRPGLRWSLREIHRVLPTMTEADAPVVRTVSRAVEEVLGRAPEHVVSPGTYDQKHVDRIGQAQELHRLRAGAARARARARRADRGGRHGGRGQGHGAQPRPAAGTRSGGMSGLGRPPARTAGAGCRRGRAPWGGVAVRWAGAHPAGAWTGRGRMMGLGAI